MPNETTFLIHYPHADGSSHSYQEHWVSTSYYCMKCGSQSMWNRDDGGDYYQGEQFMCQACGYSWNLPSEPWAPTEQDAQRWEALRNAQCIE